MMTVGQLDDAVFMAVEKVGSEVPALVLCGDTFYAIDEVTAVRTAEQPDKPLVVLHAPTRMPRVPFPPAPDLLADLSCPHCVHVYPGALPVPPYCSGCGHNTNETLTACDCPMCSVPAIQDARTEALFPLDVKKWNQFLKDGYGRWHSDAKEMRIIVPGFIRGLRRLAELAAGDMKQNDRRAQALEIMADVSSLFFDADDKGQELDPDLADPQQP